MSEIQAVGIIPGSRIGGTGDSGASREAQYCLSL